MTSNIRLTKVCIFCGEEYIARTTVSRYCSHKCNRRHYKQKMREKKIDTAKSDIISNHQTYEQQKLSEKDFLSLKETCALIGISRTTLYRLLKKGDIKSNKFGSRVIIRRKDIEVLYG